MANDFPIAIILKLVNQLTSPVRDAVRDLQKIKKEIVSLEGIGRRFSSGAGLIGSGLKSAALAAAGLEAGVTASLMPFVKAGMALEEYQASIENFTGTAEKAKGVYKNLLQFAADTPVDIGPAQDAWRMLAVKGIQPTNAMMTTMADTAYATNKDITSVAKAIGDATSGRVMGLKQLGFSAKMKKGLVIIDGKSFNPKQTDKMMLFIMAKLEKRFKGTTDRMNKTLKGVFDDMGDVWELFKFKVNEAGFFDSFKNQMIDVRDTLMGG